MIGLFNISLRLTSAPPVAAFLAAVSSVYDRPARLFGVARDLLPAVAIAQFPDADRRDRPVGSISPGAARLLRGSAPPFPAVTVFPRGFCAAGQG